MAFFKFSPEMVSKSVEDVFVIKKEEYGKQLSRKKSRCREKRDK